MRTVCREIGRSGLKQTNGAGRVPLVDAREKSSSAAACECLLKGVRAYYCGVCACVSMFRRSERTKWWRNCGSDQVVLFRGVRVVRNFAYVRIIRTPHHFTRSELHTEVCVCAGSSDSKARSHSETARVCVPESGTRNNKEGKGKTA